MAVCGWVASEGLPAYTALINPVRVGSGKARVSPRQAGSVIGLLVSVWFSLVGCTAEQPAGLADKVWVADWESLPSMTVARAGAAAVVHNNFIYMIGGVDGRIYLRTVESARILPDGRLSSWQPRRLLPEARGFAAAVVHGGYLYVIGGANGRHGENLLRSVLRARIAPDGGLGEWETLAQALLLPRRCAKACLHQDRLLVLGGYAGSLLDSVEWTRVGGAGVSSWRMAEQRLIQPRYVNAVKKHGDYLFVLGGHDAERGAGLASVEVAELEASQWRWRLARPLGEGRYGLAAASWGDYLYALGGLGRTGYLDVIEYARVEEGGRLAAWRRTTPLPEALSNFSALVVGDSLYILGGAGAGFYSSRVYRARFDEQGGLGMWLSPEQAERQRQQRSEAPRSLFLPNRGRVMEVINTPAYTYVKVSDGGVERWLAAPVMALRPGMVIRYGQGVEMRGFYSQALSRRFERIWFISAVISSDTGGE